MKWILRTPYNMIENMSFCRYHVCVSGYFLAQHNNELRGKGLYIWEKNDLMNCSLIEIWQII